MAWTYAPEQIATSPLYAVRFLVGDTDPDLPLLQDEEISYLLSTKNDVVEDAAAVAIDRIVADFAKRADKSVGSLSISWSQRYDRYRQVQEDLTKRRSRKVGPPIAGGVSPTTFTPYPYGDLSGWV